MIFTDSIRNAVDGENRVPWARPAWPKPCRARFDLSAEELVAAARDALVPMRPTRMATTARS